MYSVCVSITQSVIDMAQGSRTGFWKFFYTVKSQNICVVEKIVGLGDWRQTFWLCWGILFEKGGGVGISQFLDSKQLFCTWGLVFSMLTPASLCISSRQYNTVGSYWLCRIRYMTNLTIRSNINKSVITWKAAQDYGEATRGLGVIQNEKWKWYLGCVRNEENDKIAFCKLIKHFAQSSVLFSEATWFCFFPRFRAFS